MLKDAAPLGTAAMSAQGTLHCFREAQRTQGFGALDPGGGHLREPGWLQTESLREAVRGVGPLIGPSLLHTHIPSLCSQATPSRHTVCHPPPVPASRQSCLGEQSCGPRSGKSQHLKLGPDTFPGSKTQGTLTPVDLPEHPGGTEPPVHSGCRLKPSCWIITGRGQQRRLETWRHSSHTRKIIS